MGHGPQQNTRTAILAALLCCSVATLAAQSTRPLTPLPSTPGAADDAAAAPSTSVANALQQLAGQASVIFTGTVVSTTPDTLGGAKVKFAVEKGVRGVASGATYIMQISAWGGGVERFYPGERALFLLTAPSVAGYSAPVMGERGVVPLSGDALVGDLDLRWIATDVQRGSPSQDSSDSPTAQVHSAAVVAAGVILPSTAKTLEQSTPATTTVSSAALPDVQAIDRDLVLDLLHDGAAIAGRSR